MHLVIVDSNNKIIFMTNDLECLFREVHEDNQGFYYNSTAAVLVDRKEDFWEVGMCVDYATLRFAWKL